MELSGCPEERSFLEVLADAVNGGEFGGVFVAGWTAEFAGCTCEVEPSPEHSGSDDPAGVGEDESAVGSAVVVAYDAASPGVKSVDGVPDVDAGARLVGGGADGLGGSDEEAGQHGDDGQEELG